MKKLARRKAVRVCREIRAMFVQMYRKLQEIDGKNTRKCVKNARKCVKNARKCVLFGYKRAIFDEKWQEKMNKMTKICVEYI